jgi:hypothetical protein
MSLTIIHNNDDVSEMTVDFTAPPDWKTFKIAAEVTSIVVTNANRGLPFAEENFAQVASVIQSQQNITTIRFDNCSFAEGIWGCCTAAKRDDSLVSLNFKCCTIDSLTASFLKVTLQQGSTDNLSFVDCAIDKVAAEMIMTGLRSNTSLKHFDYDPHERKVLGASLTSGVSALLRNSDSRITHLSMGMHHETLYQLCDAVGWNTTLASIEIRNVDLTDESVTAITGMLRRTDGDKALKKVTLVHCRIRYQCMAYLLNVLSRRQLLSDLVLRYVQIDTTVSEIYLSELSWAKMQVKMLVLDEVTCDLDILSAMMVDVSNNPHIKGLLLFSQLDTEEKLQRLCETILQTNRGPPALGISKIGSHGAMISGAMQQNTSVKKLMIANLDPVGLVTFAEGLANMRGLRRLNFGYATTTHKYSKAFFKALQESLERNTTLQFLSIGGMDGYTEEAKPFLPRIKFLLAWNRVGRESLLRANVPSCLWAHILASSPVLDETSLIHFFLTSVPDITASSYLRQESEIAVASRPSKKSKLDSH